MITQATFLVKLIGFIIPMIIILFTFGNIVFSIGEISEKKTNIPKILLLTIFKVIIFVLLLDSILYNLTFENILNCVLICLIGSYIVFESIVLNKLLFKINSAYKEHKESKTKKCLNLNNLVYNGWYLKNKKYWIFSLIFVTIIFLINTIDVFDDMKLKIFNQSILIYSSLLIFLKHKIMKEFKTYKQPKIK